MAHEDRIKLDDAAIRKSPQPVLPERDDDLPLAHVVVPLSEVTELSDVEIDDSVVLILEGTVVRILDDEDGKKFGIDVSRWGYPEETLEELESRINK